MSGTGLWNDGFGLDSVVVRELDTHPTHAPAYIRMYGAKHLGILEQDAPSLASRDKLLTELVWNLSVNFQFPKYVRPKCLWTQLDRPTTNHSKETAALSDKKNICRGFFFLSEKIPSSLFETVLIA